MNNRKGFTIIELVLVLSVLAMLTVFIVPNVKNVRNKSREMAEKTVLFKLQSLLESYYFDNGRYVTGENINAADLFGTFQEAGYISRIPSNPFTGSAYTSNDKMGKIVYSSRDDGYEMIAYKTDGATVLAQVDGE